MINEMRIAVCGEIPTTCNMLRQEGISQIDFYADGIMLWSRLPRAKPYHLILFHSQAGSGMTDLQYSYKEKQDGERSTVPVMLVSEPACSGELDMVRVTLNSLIRT